jgi:hypothetical protein
VSGRLLEFGSANLGNVDCHKFDLGDEDYTMEQYSIFQQFQLLVEHKPEEKLKEIGGDLEALNRRTTQQVGWSGEARGSHGGPFWRCARTFPLARRGARTFWFGDFRPPDSRQSVSMVTAKISSLAQSARASTASAATVSCWQRSSRVRT